MTRLRVRSWLAAAALVVGAAGCPDDSGFPPPADAAVDAAGGADGGGGGDGTPPGPDGPTTTHVFTILHTNDLHSHLMGHGPESDYTPATTGDDMTIGGIARLAAKVKAERAVGPSVLLLDAGDFTQGTPFAILATGVSTELTEMQKLGYDAITIGNHELDWGPAGLAAILKAGIDYGFKVPLVATNLVFSDSDPADDSLAAFRTAGVIRPKLIKEIAGLKIGIFGLMGDDAAQSVPQMAPIKISPLAATAAAMVGELRGTDKVDLVIALSHSGVDPMGRGEDRKVAEDRAVRAAGGIDVIISGHTHDALPMPVKTGKTIIVQAGQYGAFLGRLRLTATRSAAGTTLAMDSYLLDPVDDRTAGDAPTQAAVETYIAAIDMLLAPVGLRYKAPVAATAADILEVPYGESGLGNLVADAYLGVAKALQPDAVIGVDAAGDIRDDIKKGRLWFADLFRVQPLGIGPVDQRPGYPLVTFYVHGRDLKAALELSAMSKTLGRSAYFLHVSSTMRVRWNASAPLFQRVTGVDLEGMPVDLTDTTRCYKVVTNYYVGSLLGLIRQVSGGIAAVEPKADATCRTVVTDLRTRILDADPATAGVQDLKEWAALIRFAASFPDTTGDMIPDIPARYAAPASPPRIVVTP
jgi:5'-nucleotidase/UDP-sugar diphosphatase